MLSDYHLHVCKIQLAIQIYSSLNRTEIETPVGGRRRGAGDSTEPYLTALFPLNYCDAIPRSTVYKQLWVPSYQVLTSLHVFPLSSASKCDTVSRAFWRSYIRAYVPYAQFVYPQLCVQLDTKMATAIIVTPRATALLYTLVIT